MPLSSCVFKPSVPCTKCIVCESPFNRLNVRKYVPQDTIVKLFAERRIFLDAKNNSVCAKCLKKPADEWKIETSDCEGSSLTPNQLFQMAGFQSQYILKLKKEIANPTVYKGLKFAMLDDDQCQKLTRLSKKEIQSISNMIHRQTQTIFEFLFICKTNCSQHDAGVIFCKEQGRISQNINSVLQGLTDHFVPNHLGFQVYTRDKIMRDHTLRRVFPM
jgi:hypothetical protein